MVRIVVIAAIVMMVSAVAFTLRTADSPKGQVEVRQLAESSERTGIVEVKELPAPAAVRRQTPRVEVQQLPAPEASTRTTPRKS
jgi:hypothetical protein